jgi:hypothetical protein
MIRYQRYAILAVCALGLAFGQNQAQAQTIGFQIFGGGYAPKGLPLPGQSPRIHTSTGFGTALGSYTGIGQVETLSADFHANGDITGNFQSPIAYRFTSSNGDVLACYYGNTDFGARKTGTFELIPVPGQPFGVFVAHFLAEFVPYPPECTGKFAGVGGSWMMYAWTEPFVLGSTDPTAYSWHGVGLLKFNQGH